MMRRPLFLLLATVVFAGCSRNGPPDARDQRRIPSKGIQIYRAESQPGLALEERTLARSEKVYLKQLPDITADEIADAFVLLDEKGHGTLRLKFTEERRRRINKISQEHFGRPIAVVVNGELRTVPRMLGGDYSHGLKQRTYFRLKRLRN